MSALIFLVNLVKISVQKLGDVTHSNYLCINKTQ